MSEFGKVNQVLASLSDYQQARFVLQISSDEEKQFRQLVVNGDITLNLELSQPE